MYSFVLLQSWVESITIAWARCIGRNRLSSHPLDETAGTWRRAGRFAVLAAAQILKICKYANHFIINLQIDVCPYVRSEEQERLLAAASVPATEASAENGSLKAELPKQPQPHQERTYQLEINTSDFTEAGTDARVSLVLHGSCGSSVRQNLPSGPGSFLPGRVACCATRCEDLGELQQLTIGHDDTGLQPDWHLDRVEVLNQATGAIILILKQLFDPGEPPLTFLELHLNK